MVLLDCCSTWKCQVLFSHKKKKKKKTIKNIMVSAAVLSVLRVNLNHPFNHHFELLTYFSKKYFIYVAYDI